VDKRAWEFRPGEEVPAISGIDQAFCYGLYLYPYVAIKKRRMNGSQRFPLCGDIQSQNEHHAPSNRAIYVIR
jgi:hypothetical protein